LLEWQNSSLPVLLGFAGACVLLYSSLLLVREARLAVYSTLQEMAFAGKQLSEANRKEKVKGFGCCALVVSKDTGSN
jgi:hypothetical protein